VRHKAKIHTWSGPEQQYSYLIWRAKAHF